MSNPIQYIKVRTVPRCLTVGRAARRKRRFILACNLEPLSWIQQTKSSKKLSNCKSSHVNVVTLRYNIIRQRLLDERYESHH